MASQGRSRLDVGAEVVNVSTSAGGGRGGCGGPVPPDSRVCRRKRLDPPPGLSSSGRREGRGRRADGEEGSRAG